MSGTPVKRLAQKILRVLIPISQPHKITCAFNELQVRVTSTIELRNGGRLIERPFPRRSIVRVAAGPAPIRRGFFELVVGECPHVRVIRTHHVEIARGLRIAGVECRFVLAAAAHARERHPLPMRLRVANQRSIKFSQEALVGTKCR